MNLQFRVNVNSVVSELKVALRMLTEARIVSRYRRIFKGKGLEFEDYRIYNEDMDDSSTIDWKASSRAQKLMIKEFREEREMPVYFLLDVSSSMIFGSTRKLKYEYATELTAALAYFIIESGDKAGLVMFSDSVKKFVRPDKGVKQFYMMLHNMLKSDMYGGECDLGKAMRHVMNISKEKGLVIVVSDFLGLKSGWEHDIKTGAQKFDGIAVMIKDPRDRTLPDGVGQVVISDPFSDGELLIDCNDDKMRKAYEDYVIRKEGEVKRVLKEAGFDILELTTDNDFTLPVLKFLKRREMLFTR